MTEWRPTAALGRAASVGLLGLVAALAVGRPMLAALSVPFLIHAGIGLARRSRTAPTVWSELDVHTLHEGQGTRSRLYVRASGAEQVVRTIGRTAHVATDPASGTRQHLLSTGGAEDHGPDQAAPIEVAPLVLGPRRWGRSLLGQEKVALVSAWSGFAWGPVSLGQKSITVLPVRSSVDASAPAPHPVGLVGAHRASRPGAGVELGGIRPFTPGDRLRRIHWRTTLRTGVLQTVVSDAEEDAAVLLLVDALADHGRSGGLGGAQTSLDVTVRAAAAIAEHHLRIGDRVGLRVVGGGGAVVPISSGATQFHRILGVLARIRPGGTPSSEPLGLLRRLPAGTVVVALTPLLDQRLADVAVAASRSRHDVVVIDTLPVDADPVLDEATTPAAGALAWRLRRLDRAPVRRGLERGGCAVVGWHGPRTLDRVLREIARGRTKAVRL